ncbi:MAG: DsbA family protein [Paracoccaceae bacterium]
MSDPVKPIDRRRLIVGVGALATIAYAGYQAGWVQRLLPQKSLPFVQMDNPAGYRLLKAGAITGGFDPFVGLDGEKSADQLQAALDVQQNVCTALFNADPGASDVVPMAYFFDYQCPICRRLTPRLRALQGVSISWHDLAGLGPSSEMAARASIAARRQGAYDKFHDRLMRTRFQATTDYAAELAKSIGIDPELLVADMQSDEIMNQIWRSQATADYFGMLGTPGLVIGRTVVIGDIDSTTLNRIVALEQAEALTICAAQ